jgi:hypothetical protein
VRIDCGIPLDEFLDLRGEIGWFVKIRILFRN